MHYKQITAYDLYSFSKSLQEAVQDGYEVLDETVYYPQVIGSTFLATVGKSETKVEGVLTETKPVRKKKEKTDE